MFIRVAVPKSLADIATTMFTSPASKLLTKLNTILRWRERETGEFRLLQSGEWSRNRSKTVIKVSVHSGQGS